MAKIKLSRLILTSAFALGGSAAFAQLPMQTQPLKAQTQPGNALPVSLPNAKPVAPDAGTLKHLEAWEAAMKKVETYYAAATMSEENKSLKRESKFEAKMWLFKPNMARIDIYKAEDAKKPTAFPDKMYISNGKSIYEYDGARKTRSSASLGSGGIGNILLLDLMSGMSTKQITERFTVKTAKEDENFVFLDVKPVFANDKEDFESLTLVLCGSKFGDRAYIPRMIILGREAGSVQEKWDFPDPKVNPKGIDEATFKLVALLPDWKEINQDRVRPFSPKPEGGTSPKVPIPGGGK